MGQIFEAAAQCAKNLYGETEEEKRRAFELSVDGIPASFKEKYLLGPVLHSTAHGKLHAITEVIGGRKFVSKHLDKTKKSFVFLDIKSHALAISEIRKCRLRDDLLVSYWGFYESRDLFIAVQEKIEGVSLVTHLQEKTFLDEDQVAEIFTQCLEAAQFLHNKKILHRDFRLEQFMFADKTCKHVKLCDLLHSIRSDKVSDLAKPVVFLFASPETLSKGEFTKYSDMWSLGCCLFEMIYGHPPHTGEDKPLVKRIINDPISFRPVFSSASDDVVALLKHLLNRDPYSRYSATHALEHPWFGEAGNITLQQREAKIYRRGRLAIIIEDAKKMADIRRARQAEDEVKANAVVLRSEFSRSLSGSLPTSCSTPTSKISSEEYRLEIGEWNSESDDWHLDPARSDLQSLGLPESGKDSHSDTYHNSEHGWNVRTKGLWDEFDSANFEDDVKNTSCWSEAEYSDWDQHERETVAHDLDFQRWVVETGPPALQNEQVVDSETESKAGESADSDQQSRVDNDSADESDSKSARENDDRGEGDGFREESDDDKEDGHESSEAASDALEREARQRDGLGNASGSAQVSTSSLGSDSLQSAPWEYPVAVQGNGSGNNSSGSGTNRSTTSKGSAASRRGGAVGMQLPPIQEDAPASVNDLGELTRRALERAGVDTMGGADDTAARIAPAVGMVSLSRRSRSSSGSSGTGRNESELHSRRSSDQA